MDTTNGANTVYYVIPQKQLGQMGRPPSSVGPTVSVMSSPSSQVGRGASTREREKPVAIHIPERSGQNNILVTEAGKDSVATTTNSIPILIKSGPGSPRVASTSAGGSPSTQLVVVTNGPRSNIPSLPPNPTQLLPVLSVAKAAAGDPATPNGQLTSTHPEPAQGTNRNSTITVYPWHSLVPFLTTGEGPVAPSTSAPNNSRGPNNHQDKDKQPPGSSSNNNNTSSSNNNNNNSTGVFKVEQGGEKQGGEGSNGPVKDLELPEPSPGPDEEDDVFFFEECPTPTTPGGRERKSSARAEDGKLHGKGPNQTSDERIYDFQQAPSSSGPPAASKPGQSNRVKDPRGMVVRPRQRGEAEVPRPRPPGEGGSLQGAPGVEVVHQGEAEVKFEQ